MTLQELQDNLKTMPNEIRSQVSKLAGEMFDVQQNIKMARFHGEITDEQFKKCKECWNAQLKIFMFD